MDETVRERLDRVVTWLNWHDGNFVDGIRTVEDAFLLFDYGLAHPDLDELAETWTPETLIDALGYDPHNPD